MGSEAAGRGDIVRRFTKQALLQQQSSWHSYPGSFRKVLASVESLLLGLFVGNAKTIYMGWLKKKPDPLTERARDLNNEIAALEAQIKKLDAKLVQDNTHPRLRSTAVPHGDTVAHTLHPSTSTHNSPDAPLAHEPIFEDLDQRHLKTEVETTSTPEHYNELGARKYDVTELVKRVKGIFSGPTTTNPRLVSYLAAGGIQGLQPLRREKRIARNRFLIFAGFLLFLLLGIIYVFTRNR